MKKRKRPQAYDRQASENKTANCITARQAAGDAEAGERSKDAKLSFWAIMSHEIRTPMNAIVGLGEVLARTEMNQEQKTYLAGIQKSSGVLLSIIDDISDFSKIESGKMEIVNMNYQLNALLADLCSMFSCLFDAKNIKLRCLTADDLPKVVCGDKNRTRQILSNLLSNALKYTQKGRVELHVWAGANARLRFDVKDTGVGIREEDLGRIFKPFEQSDPYENKNIAGTGLGLAISRGLCELMGGRMWADSIYGEGTTFSVELPLLLANGAAPDAEETPGDFWAPDASALVVDDIETNRIVAEAMLKEFGITPDLAGSGEEAAELAKRRAYDIIFMDYMMPDMDGIETTKRIRETNIWNRGVPIVALSANALKESREMFLANRLTDFLPKPLEMSALNLCLRKWLPHFLINEKYQGDL